LKAKRTASSQIIRRTAGNTSREENRERDSEGERARAREERKNFTRQCENEATMKREAKTSTVITVAACDEDV